MALEEIGLRRLDIEYLVYILLLRDNKKLKSIFIKPNLIITVYYYYYYSYCIELSIAMAGVGFCRVLFLALSFILDVLSSLFSSFRLISPLIP